jgi:hypothetical protein
VKFKAISTGSATYGGSLYVNRDDGSELWVGSADIIFGANNSNATINWSANFKKESLSDSDPAENDHSRPLCARIITFFPKNRENMRSHTRLMGKINLS